MAVMQALAVAGIGVGLLLLYFSLEVLGLGQRLRRIPLRIAITGTRGKSSVTRLLAACLRDSGIRVVARTTGSKPCFIHPDGTEAEIRRIGFPSILEGKKLVARAADLRAEALVVELMGIQPESLRCESLRVFSPQILVITNVRKDHVEALGRRRGEIARHLAAAMPDKSTVFLPQEEYDSAFDERAGRTGSKLVLVP
ncbi:MAG: Mur ligase family protein, partial [Candidatus Aminicenantales bacterium]